MKVDWIFISTLLSVTCVVQGRISHEESGTDKPVERQIPLPPRNIKIVVSPKPIQQPLTSLYKAYVIKKPLMRKFVPVVRTTEPPMPITRRPLMKQRLIIIESTSPKPQLEKDEVQIILRRRDHLKPKRRPMKIASDANIEINEGPISKSRIVALLGPEKNGDNLAIKPEDLMFASSNKVYTVLRPDNNSDNSKFDKVIETNELPEKKFSDQNSDLDKGSNAADPSKKLNNDPSDKPSNNNLDDSVKIATIDKETQTSDVDPDSNEFIFMNSPKPKTNIVKEKEDTVLGALINKD